MEGSWGGRVAPQHVIASRPLWGGEGCPQKDTDFPDLLMGYRPLLAGVLPLSAQ